MARVVNPKRGEIWLVSFEPQVGEEIKKTIPALILNVEVMNHLPTRLAIPSREKKSHHHTNFYYVPIDPVRQNGLTKPSTIDCSQIKSLSLQRFVKKLGKAHYDILGEIVKVMALAVGYL